MTVTSAQDFASFMDDWGEDWDWNGRTIKGDFAEPPADAQGMRGTAPTLRIVYDAETPIEAGDTLVRISTGQAYTVADIYQGNTALPSPAWRLVLNKA